MGSHLCCRAVGGSVPCSRAPQPWYWGWRECCTFTPPTYNSCLRLEPATFGLRVWPLTIRPRLPHPTFLSVSAGMPGSRYVGVEGWSSKQVAVWLRDQGFREYVDLLCSKHRLDGASLLCLTETDLRSPPLELKVLGDIKRLMLAMRRLQRQHTALTQLGSEVSAFSLMHTGGTDHVISNGFAKRGSGDHQHCNGAVTTVGEHSYSNGKRKQYCVQLDPEYWKTALSTLYAMLVCGVTSFVMVLVHERVPDMRTYPPLPDIFLDRWVISEWVVWKYFRTGVLYYFTSSYRVGWCIEHNVFLVIKQNHNDLSAQLYFLY